MTTPHRRVSALAAVIFAISGCVTLVVLFVAFQGNSSELFVTLAFIVGLCVGVALDDAWDLYRAARRDSLVSHQPETTQQTTDRHRFNNLTALGWSLIIASAAMLAVGVMLIVTKNATESYSKCTAQWQQQFGEAYTARVTAANEVSEAIDGIVQGIADQDRAMYDSAIVQYVEVRAAQKKKQAENPLPPLPEVLCGER
jgi:hypothetical protein